ncbi:MAG: short-chain dehydrogenase [Pseudonocardiales bacterium]|nr:MAG: short-chain dehydrogenase [Pseudonocardiales bacterium]
MNHDNNVMAVFSSGKAEMTTTIDVDLRGRVCLVTGATSGIGRETAPGLARSGATVLMVARDRPRGERVIAQIRSLAPQGGVELLVAELASQRDVRELAHQVSSRHQQLDVLVNNAGAVNSTRRLSPDGIEATMAVNHVAPFLLTHLLEPTLLATPGARVITVSSYLHHRVKHIAWENVQYQRDYSAQGAYTLSKLMNILFTYELARRWAATSQTANTLHPGWPLKTNLGREQQGAGGLFDRVTKLVGGSAAKGARTSLHLARSPELAEVSGRYFQRCRPARSSALSHEQDAARQLWTTTAELCGVTSGTGASGMA